MSVLNPSVAVPLAAGSPPAFYRRLFRRPPFTGGYSAAL
jgi:hypothetical protein